MQLEVGKIYEGKVTGITKFGAFVELEKGVTGMVHISEIANTYVNEIKDHVTEGQTVKVKVLSLGEKGKVSLSIKKALPQNKKQASGDRSGNGQRRGGQQTDNHGERGRRSQQTPQRKQRSNDRGAKNTFDTPQPDYNVRTTSGDAAFEDMLSRYMASSEERLSDGRFAKEVKRRGSSKRRG